MKRLICLFMALALPLSLAGCGSGGSGAASASAETVSVAQTSEASEAPPPATEASSGEAADIEDPAAEASAEEAVSFATEDALDQVRAMAQKALDQQEIQNQMSRHVMLHCYGLHRQEVEELWVQEPENQATASFGQNMGFFVGYAAIWQGYVEAHDTSWLNSAKQYCESKGIDLSGMTDAEILDEYGGVGQLLLHVTTTAIIEIAEDGQTAKCFWYSPGMVSETGQNANAIWEAYGVDFVKENGQWKIWHLHMFTDFTGSFFVNLGGASSAGFGAPPFSFGSSGDETATEGGEQLALENATPNEYLYAAQYKTFSRDRLRSEMELFLPAAYASWSFDDSNYGPTREQLESYDIDLDAWYEAHSS